MPAVEKVLQFLKMCKGFDTVTSKVKIISAGAGSCVGELKVEPEHSNVMGGLHGGLSATLIDTISSAGLFTLESGECPHVSVTMNLVYHKGAKVGDEIIIDSKTLRAGKNLAFLEVDIKNKATGELLVKGSHVKYLLTGARI